MYQSQLSEATDIRRVAGATAAGTTTLTGQIDMNGFDAVAVVISLSGIVNGAQPVLTLQEGAASNGSDAASIVDVNGNAVATNAVTLTGTPSTGLLVADVVRPQKRYVTYSLARTTQNVAVDAVFAVLYRGRSLAIVPLTAYLASVAAPAKA